MPYFLLYTNLRQCSKLRGQGVYRCIFQLLIFSRISLAAFMLTVGKKRRKTGSQLPLGITSAAPFSSFRQLAPFQRSAPLPWLRLASMHRRPPQFNMTILPPRFSSIATFAWSCAFSARRFLTWCSCHASAAYAARHTPISPPAATATHFHANHCPASLMPLPAYRPFAPRSTGARSRALQLRQGLLQPRQKFQQGLLSLKHRPLRPRPFGSPRGRR